VLITKDTSKKDNSKITGEVIKTVPPQEIKIGALLVLSGEGASWGDASRKAIDLAVKEANLAGGINGKRIEVIYEDTQGNPTSALSAYRKLKDIDNVDVIIGPNMQSEVAVLAPVVYQDRFPIITPAYAPLENRPDAKNPLMIWLDVDMEARQMAKYVYDNNIRTVSVIGTYDNWEKQVSTSFSEGFSDIGGEVLFFDLLNVEDQDVRTVVHKAIKDSPDAIFIGSYFQFLNVGKVLKESGYSGKIYSIEVDDYLASESKGIIPKLEFISPDIYSSEFRQKYFSEYGEKSNIPVGQTYDAMQILISMLKQSNSRRELLDLMKNFTFYEGVSGRITITNEGRTSMPMAVFYLNEGETSKIMSIKE
jgi:branched-chain amino acid transport system substrate-binding protein